MAGAALYQTRPLTTVASNELEPSSPFTVRRRPTSETYTPYIDESGPIAEIKPGLPAWVFPVGIGVLLLIAFNARKR